MNTKVLREVVACLPKGRTLFRHAKDDYAFWLLNRGATRLTNFQALKKSRFGSLLHKPVVKELMGQTSSAYWFTPGFGQGRAGESVYRLGLDEWGDDDTYWRFDQVSRKGKSLVLQVNLNGNEHQGLRRLVGPEGADPFGYDSHPTRFGRNATLSWARLDFDFETGEALIEEIQTDRLRDVRELLLRQPCSTCGKLHFRRCRFKRKDLEKYWEQHLARHETVWSEMTLLAALRFLVEEIGISKVFYHTYETGCRLKGIDGTRPPKSLYTKLPKKFCFQETDEVPQFLLARKTAKGRRHFEKRAGQDPRFFVLEV